MQAEQSRFEEKANNKVMAMFEKAEDEYNDSIDVKGKHQWRRPLSTSLDVSILTSLYVLE